MHVPNVDKIFFFTSYIDAWPPRTKKYFKGIFNGCLIGGPFPAKTYLIAKKLRVSERDSGA